MQSRNSRDTHLVDFCSVMKTIKIVLMNTPTNWKPSVIVKICVVNNKPSRATTRKEMCF